MDWVPDLAGCPLQRPVCHLSPMRVNVTAVITPGETLTDYRIVCTNKESDHGHITNVGLGVGDGTYYSRPTVAEVYALIDAGHTFHTGSTADGNYATVAKFTCTHCGRGTLRSHADQAWNNNLDSLGNCNT